MGEYEATYDKICGGQDLGELIFPGLRNYTTALTVCQNVHGNLIQVETEAQQQKAGDLMNSSSCSYSWIGWTDDDQEGKWISALNSSISLGKQHFQSWAPGEPAGGTSENCAILWIKEGTVQCVCETMCHIISGFFFVFIIKV